MTSTSPPLRLARLWISLGWLLVIMIIILSLIPPPPIIKESSSLWLLPFNLPYSDKIAHFIAYFILMSWFSQIYHSTYHRRLYVVSFSLLGVLLEILQGLGGVRSADWQDAVTNFIGILVAWQLAKTNFAYQLVYLEAKYFSSC